MYLTKWRFQKLTLSLTLPLALGSYSDVKASQPYYVSVDEFNHYQVSRPEGVNLLSKGRAGERIKNFTNIFRFVLPSGGAPGKRKDAASRDCPVTAKPLTALVPRTNIGLTISERPNFWFYMPYQPTSPTEFILLDNKKNLVYKTTFEVKNTPGIINISLPQNVEPLIIWRDIQLDLLLYLQSLCPTSGCFGQWIC